MIFSNIFELSHFILGFPRFCRFQKFVNYKKAFFVSRLLTILLVLKNLFSKIRTDEITEVGVSSVSYR